MLKSPSSQDTPVFWTSSLSQSEALQIKIARQLFNDAGLTRQALDAAWEQASLATKNVFRSNAAKVFGLDSKTPEDYIQVDTLLSQLGLSRFTMTSPNGQLSLAYFNAKAVAEWAVSLISKQESAS